MISLFSDHVKYQELEPVVYAYYDRADMLRNTADVTNHAHSLCEIMYVNEGTIEVIVNGEPVILGRHQYILLDTDVRHRLILSETVPSGVMNIEFTFEAGEGRGPATSRIYAMDPAFRFMTDTPVPYFILVDKDDTVCQLMKKLVLITDESRREGSPLSTLLCSHLLCLIARQYTESKQKNHQEIDNVQVLQAIDFIQRNYGEPITANQIAKALEVQPTYLHRLFRKYTGNTLVHRIHEIRIEKARSLLRETDLSILEIVSMVGFSSQQYFAQLFKSAEGKTPMEYRRACREKGRP